MNAKLIFLVGVCAFLALCAAPGVVAAENENWVGHENGLLQPLVGGDWYGAVVAVYTQTLGPAFHVIVFLLGPVLVGIKYQRFAPVGMAILIAGVVFAMFFPSELQFLFAVAAILGLAAVLYGVMHK